LYVTISSLLECSEDTGEEVNYATLGQIAACIAIIVVLGILRYYGRSIASSLIEAIADSSIITVLVYMAHILKVVSINALTELIKTLIPQKFLMIASWGSIAVYGLIFGLTFALKYPLTELAMNLGVSVKDFLLALYRELQRDELALTKTSRHETIFALVMLVSILYLLYTLTPVAIDILRTLHVLPLIEEFVKGALLGAILGTLINIPLSIIKAPSNILSPSTNNHK